MQASVELLEKETLLHVYPHWINWLPDYLLASLLVRKRKAVPDTWDLAWSLLARPQCC